MPQNSFNIQSEIAYHQGDPALPPSIEEQTLLENDMPLWVPDFPKVFQGKDILDLGGGRGTASILISRKFRPRLVTHFDLSFNRLAAALSWQQGHNAYHIACGNAYTLPFAAASFDLVIANSFLHHLPNVAQPLTEVGRVLRPGGMYIGREPNFNNPIVRLGVFSPLGHVLIPGIGHSENEYPLRAQQIEHGFARGGCNPDLHYFWRRMPSLSHPMLSVAISVRAYKRP